MSSASRRTATVQAWSITPPGPPANDNSRVMTSSAVATLSSRVCGLSTEDVVAGDNARVVDPLGGP